MLISAFYFSEIIIDSYKKKSYIIKKKRGVIRSHKRYPEEQSKPLQPRRIKLLVPPSSTLYIDLQRSTECAQKNDVILWQVKHDRRIRVKEAFYQVKTFNSSVADYLELIVRQVPASNSCLGGFMLPFSCKLFRDAGYTKVHLSYLAKSSCAMNTLSV